jgi:hypothetical protein
MRASRTLIFQLGQPKFARHVRVSFVVSALPVRWLPIPFRARVREFGAAASTGGAQTPSSQTQIPLRRPTALGCPAAHLVRLATGPTAFQPQTIIGWHRLGFRLFWRWKSRTRPGRPPVDRDLIRLIQRMWHANPTWGSRRIQAELAKLGIQVSDSTIRKYRPAKNQWGRRLGLRGHANPEMPWGRMKNRIG